MGRCHEFGLQISEGCNHEMVAGDNECACAACGIVCGGQFAGCPDVWARGQPAVMRTDVNVAHLATLETVGVAASGNGPRAEANGGPASWAPEPPLPPVTPWSTASGRERVDDVRSPDPEPPFAGPEEHAPSPAAGPAPAEPVVPSAPSDDALAAVTAELRAVSEGLRLQQSMLGDLLSGLTRQQAMMAELLDARHAELRLAMVAESLPDAVADAVSKSFAANQQELSETAASLAETLGMDRAIAKALRQVANWSDDRFEELCERQEKLLSKAMRAGGRQAEARAASKARAATTSTATRTPAAKRASTAKAAKSAQPAKKASRSSAQGTRPSRRSLGS